MKDKTLYTLRLGDREVTLAFKVGTLRRMKGILGKDPFEALADADSVAVLEYARAITEAAMLTYDKGVDVAALEADFDNLSIPDAKDIINAFNAAILPDTTPEGGTNTQPGEAADAG